MIPSVFRIGKLAKVTGTSAPTIRYYEEIGLLPRATRGDGNQRTYSEGDVQRLTFIRRCREFGFSITQVKRLVLLVQDGERPCMEARDLAYAHLIEVRKKLDELRKLERDIAACVDNCDQSCASGSSADCVILEELGGGSTADL